MDSSGLGVILGRYRRLKEQGGQMIIFGACKIKKILEISVSYLNAGVSNRGGSMAINREEEASLWKIK